MAPYRVTLKFADGRFMVLSLDVTEEQRQALSPVMYLSEKDGEEVLALLKAWFPASFTETPALGTGYKPLPNNVARGGW